METKPCWHRVAIWLMPGVLCALLWYRSYRHEDAVLLFDWDGRIHLIRTLDGDLHLAATEIRAGKEWAFSGRVHTQPALRGPYGGGLFMGQSFQTYSELSRWTTDHADWSASLLGFVASTSDQPSEQKWMFAMPMWSALGLSLIPAFFVLRKEYRKHRRSETGMCPICGYDLRHSPDRCPECGTAREAPTKAAGSARGLQ